MAHYMMQLGLLLVVLTCAFGLFKGGSAERLGSMMILFAYVGDIIAIAATRPYLPTLMIFIGDFALAIGLLVIAIRYTSLWLGCAMIIQSVAMCSYGLAASGDGLHNRSYVILNNALSLIMLACIIAGTLASWRKRVQARSRGDQLDIAQPALA